MEPKGVRLACPDCTWSCVMTSEDDMPTGVTKKIEGTPYCPNCNVAMRPVASVDTTERPKPEVKPLTLEDAAKRCAGLERECHELADDLQRAKEKYSDLKKAYDGKVVTLRLAVERMGRLLAGEIIQADLPLFDDIEESATLGPDAADALHAAVDTAAGELLARFAKQGVVHITREQIDAWTSDEYDQALTWVQACEELPAGALFPSWPSCMHIPLADEDPTQEVPLPVAACPEPAPEPEAPVDIETRRGRRRKAADEPVHA